jgi:LPXTG-site transpeptidase (sortase) family protein
MFFQNRMPWISHLMWSTIMAFGLTFAPALITSANAPALNSTFPTRLSIPSIDLDSAVVPVGWTPVVINGQTYGQWDTADNEVGWHNLSANLGEVGNTVLAGHSDINSRVFQNLEYVNIDDEITVISGADQQPYRYRVTQKVLVQEVGVSLETRIQNARWIAPTDDERLTLLTCSQPGATHRLIVVAYPVERVQDQTLAETSY